MLISFFLTNANAKYNTAKNENLKKDNERTFYNYSRLMDR